MSGSETADKPWKHCPIMAETIADALAAETGGGVFIDATVGGGGHAEALLERAGRDSRLLGIDRDDRALELAGKRLRRYGDSVSLLQGCFAEMESLAAAAQWPAADGIVMDLGISSDQLADAERGFGFMQDGPLDMRMDRNRGETAADLLARLGEEELVSLFRLYGEEPAARRIARRIVRERRRAPLLRTARLAELIVAAKGRAGSRGAHHPATLCFQALRIAVNRELEQLEAGLEAALRLLRTGGRLAVLSFHSLEDRRVKACFRRHAGKSVSLAAGGSSFEYETPPVKILTRRPLVPDAAEIARNPRARSAKLRIIQREADIHEKRIKTAQG